MLPIILRGSTALNRANTVRKSLGGGSGGGNKNFGGTGGTGSGNQTSSMTVRPKTSLVSSSNITINFSSGSGGGGYSSSKAKSNSLEKNVKIIKTTVISIDRIIKSNFILEQQAEKNTAKREELLGRKQRESNLESKKKSVDLTGNKKRKVRVPGQGLLGGILDFFVNMFLGWASLKLLKHIPTLTKILKPLASAVDFFIDFAGKMLNGLVTFIDWGVRLHDWSRKGVDKIFGEKGLKVFDGFINALTTITNLAILAMMAGINPLDPFGRGKSKGGPRPRPGKGGRPKVTTSGGGGAGRPNIRNPLRNRPTVSQGRGGQPRGPRIPGTGPKITGAPKGGLPKIPRLRTPRGLKGSGLIGLLLLLPTMFEVGGLIQEGYWKTGLNVAISSIAGIAAGSSAAGAGLTGSAAAALTGIGIPAAVAGVIASLAIGGVAGWAAYEASYNTLKLFGLRDDNPELKAQGYAGGGKVGQKLNGQRNKDILYTEPQYKPVEFDKEGKEFYGGIQYTFENGILTETKAPESQQKASKHIKSSIREYGSTEFVGPMFNLYSKSLLGKKPTQSDYREAGQGLNAWVANALNSGDLSVKDILSRKDFDMSTWSSSSLRDLLGTSSRKLSSSYHKRERPGFVGGQEGGPLGTLSGGGSYSGSATGAGILKNDPAFVQAVNQLAQRLGVNPAEMLGFMEIETAGTFSPSIDNGLGYVGLIQFGPDARKDLGVSYNELAAMSRLEQLVWVEKYFQNVNRMAGKQVFRPGGGATASDLYTAVFLPAYVGSDDNTVFPQKYWSSNPALRDNSRSGSPIWKGHIGNLVRQRAQKYGAANITYTPSTMQTGAPVVSTPDLSNVPQGSPGEAAQRLLADFPQIKSRGNNSQIFASGLGYWLKKNFVPTSKDAHRMGRGDFGDPNGGDMEHPDHGGIVAHHRGKGHYLGKALDLGAHGAGMGGAYAEDQKYLWPYIAKFLKIYGLNKEPFVPQVIHATGESFGPRKMDTIGPDSGHNDHFHVEFHKGGWVKGSSGRELLAKVLPKEFWLDVDSAQAIEQAYPGLLMAANKASSREGVIKAVSAYTSSDTPHLFVYREQVTNTVYSGPSSSSMSDNSSSSNNMDYFSVLDRLPG